MNNNKRNVKFDFELVKAVCSRTEPKLVIRKYCREKGSRSYSFCALYIMNSKHDIIRFHHIFNEQLNRAEFLELIGGLKELDKIKG